MNIDLGPGIQYFGFIVYVWLVILGIILGSFLNSWIWRLRENIKIIGKTFSICVHCRRQLRWYENIPLVSYLVLHGCCRTCKKYIPFHYVLVELFTPGLLILVSYHCIRLGHFSEWLLLRNILFLSFLIVIFIYDWLYREVVTELTWAGAVLGFLINYFFLNYHLGNIFVGFAVMGGFFLAQYLISKGRWIGGGDVRLGFMFGIWLGWPVALVSLFISYILGAIVSVGLLVTKKVNRETEVPFGSFLAVGTFIAMLYGSNIINWYLTLIR